MRAGPGGGGAFGLAEWLGARPLCSQTRGRGAWINPRFFLRPQLHSSFSSLAFRPCHLDLLFPNKMGDPSNVEPHQGWGGLEKPSLRKLNRKLSGIEPEMGPQSRRKG